MADSIMRRQPRLSHRWHYEPGVALLALQQVWLKTGRPVYYDYIKRNMDEFVGPDGSLRTYRQEEHNLDQINQGKVLFLLYETTGDERYKKTAFLLRDQLRSQPRTNEGGFWHKQIYPHQMWLDGIYMASPFCAEFARRFNEPEGFDEAANQILTIAAHARDPGTGLLYHAWDESKRQKWADSHTGCSPHFWGRALGWYAMALVDVLDHLPEEHAQRAPIVAILRTTMDAVVQVQDADSGLWYQVLDQGDRPGNYLESSASCMFVYAIAKAVRRGYLDKRYAASAKKGYDGILAQFVTVDPEGLVNLDGICAVAGLGGKPYRDGSYEYYVSEKTIANEYKGVGSFVMASLEMEEVVGC
jgi:unsaturated rhamnogalacturonyl hydrolase